MIETVDGQHGLVGPRRGVEGDLLLDGLSAALELAGVIADHDHGRRAKGEVLGRASGSGQPASTAGCSTSRRYFGLWNEWTWSPSQISPAICAMYGLTAAM